MDLKEQRLLAAMLFEGIHRHGVGLESAVDQSLQAAELLIVRSLERDKARKEAEIRARELEAELARKRALLEGMDDDAPRSSALTTS